jgi:hypothetical protein
VTQTTARERHPVLRTGEREPVDPYKRRLIYKRDGYSCGWCGWQVDPNSEAPGIILKLDHVIPWSAFGSDRSDNLRSLCTPCNDERSNFIDPCPPRIIGVTRACYWCARRRGELPDHLRGIASNELDQIKAYCGRCDATSWVPSQSWIM